ncbi:hypothetical protein [Streptomyces violaceusniger]|uniref:hypothetical protein n=1 Tax=Streptomyces violaceusniger TaxID=68280 RepID=UPI0005BBF924|nr:hypothetical protein [Streptomyces violaceusniger]
MFPFVEEELGVPALLVVFEEDFAQYVQGPVVGDQAALRAGRGVLVEDALGELVDVLDVDTAEHCRVHERGEPGAQVARSSALPVGVDLRVG